MLRNKAGLIHYKIVYVMIILIFTTVVHRWRQQFVCILFKATCRRKRKTKTAWPNKSDAGLKIHYGIIKFITSKD